MNEITFKIAEIQKQLGHFLYFPDRDNYQDLIRFLNDYQQEWKSLDAKNPTGYVVAKEPSNERV
ncbi:MAG: hypothetical protein ACRC2R_10900 [Xenococcaceae cyanobacterium]